MIDVEAGAIVGEVKAYATSHRGLSVQELTDMCLRKLLHIADTAPPDLREQAHQFKENMRVVIERYMHQAIKSDRTTLYNQLRAAGMPDMADIILKV